MLPSTPTGTMAKLERASPGVEILTLDVAPAVADMVGKAWTNPVMPVVAEARLMATAETPLPGTPAIPSTGKLMMVDGVCGPRNTAGPTAVLARVSRILVGVSGM